MKLCQERFRLDIRKRFFIQCEFGLWNRLPRAVVAAPSLTELKKCLDDTFGHLVKSLGCPDRPGSWTLILVYVSYCMYFNLPLSKSVVVPHLGLTSMPASCAEVLLCTPLKGVSPLSLPVAWSYLL